MNDFSAVLSSLIKDKNGDIPLMCRYCSIDRSNMYKIMKGKRNPPSLDTVTRISEFLRLSPPEFQALSDAWHITVLGSRKYYRRKSVEHFLLSFPENYSAIEKYYNAQDISFSPNTPSCLALETQMDVQSVLLRILGKEAYCGNGKLSVLAQPHYEFLFHTLSGLTTEHLLTVEHIFCLSNSETLTTDHQLLHIRYLETIFPLFVTSGLTYEPLYYYGDVNELFNDFGLFSCMIITTEHVLLCTADFQQGIFFNDREILKSMRETFDTLKEKCSPLFQAVSVDLAYPEQYLPLNNLITPDYNTYIIQEEGCLLPLLNTDIIQEFVKSFLPDRQKIVQFYGSFLDNIRSTQLAENAAWMHQFFTRNGLLYFVRTGRFHELPPMFCNPLSSESRIALLQEFLKYCKKGMFHMLRAPLENISANLRLVVTEKLGYLVLCREDYPMTYLLFNEQYYLDIFMDYMQSLEDNCYSVEDTVECVQDMIDSLR